MFSSTSIPILEQVLSFTETRHELLAGNVANANTPNYKSRDLSVSEFQTRLKEAIEEREETNRHISPGREPEELDSDMRHVKESLKHILFHDNSDVSLEKQVAQLSKNQMMHNMAISIISSQFRLLQTAISERV